MESRVLKVLDDEDIARIADTYHAWRNKDGAYADVPGFCKSVKLEEIEKHDFVLNPGRYVGAEEAEEDGEPFEVKMKRLTAIFRSQQAEAQKLDATITEQLVRLRYG